jgi:Spy/CpxP family protein refolding chaperone
MKKMAWIALGVFAVASVAVLTGFRHAGGCGGRFGPGGRPEEMAAFLTARVDDALDDIKATDAQRATVHAAKDRVVEKMKAVRGDRKEMRDELVAAWKADQSPDKAKLHALVDQRVEAMRAAGYEAVDAASEVHDALTPEQRAQIAQRIESHRRWRGQDQDR